MEPKLLLWLILPLLTSLFVVFIVFPIIDKYWKGISKSKELSEKISVLSVKMENVERFQVDLLVITKKLAEKLSVSMEPIDHNIRSLMEQLEKGLKAGLFISRREAFGTIAEKKEVMGNVSLMQEADFEPAPVKISQRTLTLAALENVWNLFSKEGIKTNKKYNEDDWKEVFGVKPEKYTEGKENDMIFVFKSSDAKNEYWAVPPVSGSGWKNGYYKWFNCDKSAGTITDLTKPARLKSTGKADIKYEVIDYGEVVAK